MYSFAIILQEFHTRKGPYSENNANPKGALIDMGSTNRFCVSEGAKRNISGKSSGVDANK